MAAIPSEIDGAAVTGIGPMSFYKCSSLRSVTVPEGVTSIGESAFGYEGWVYTACTSLTDVKLPESLTSIGDHAFFSCTALGEIRIPDGVVSIGANAFQHCKALTSVRLPGGLTAVSDYAFADCDRLETVAIPEGVASVGAGAFAGCPSLVSVSLPDSVTAIGPSAFDGCLSLTEAVIGGGVASMGTNVFHDCVKLTDIYFGGTEERWAALSADAGLSDTVAVHCGSAGPELRAENMADVADYYRDGVNWAVSNGYVTPRSSTLFGEKDCPRWQVVYILWQASGSPAPASRELPFDDVPEDAVYFDAVCWAAEKGFADGTGGGKFKPSDTVDRATAMTFIWKATGKQEVSGKCGFTDVPEDAWYYDAVRWAEANGYARGTGDGSTFSPDDAVTLAQMVTFLQRWDENNW